MGLSDELQTDSGRAGKEETVPPLARVGGSPRGAAVGFWIDVENGANNG